MTDVISSGPERPVGPHRRRAWLVTAVAAVALAGAVWHWGGGGSSPAPDAAPRTAQVSPVPVTPYSPSGRIARFHLDARPGPVPSGLKLLIGGTFTQTGKASSPSTIGADGKVTPLSGLRPPVQLPTMVTRLKDATGIVVENQGFTPVDTYVTPDSGPNVHFGAGLDTVLSAREGGYLAANSGTTEGQPGRLISFARDGRKRWERTVDDPTYYYADTPYGLLVDVIAPSDEGQSSHGSLALLDPRTGRLLHGLGAVDYVLTATDDKVAWVPYGCGEWPTRCTVAVTDLRTREQQTIALPGGRAPSTAAFSPNEALLAVGFAGQHEFADQVDPDGYVAVLALPTGQFQRMPGLTTPAKQSPALAWGPDLQLFLGVQVNENEDRLLLWNPTWPAPVVLPPKLVPYSASSYLAVLPAS